MLSAEVKQEGETMGSSGASLVSVRTMAGVGGEWVLDTHTCTRTPGISIM